MVRLFLMFCDLLIMKNHENEESISNKTAVAIYFYLLKSSALLLINVSTTQINVQALAANFRRGKCQKFMHYVNLFNNNNNGFKVELTQKK